MTKAERLDSVFQALSDTTRRQIVERLGKEPMTTGRLASEFPQITRIAVMKHLGVLESVGLIRTRKEGKFRWNELAPDPLKEADSWLARHVERRRDMGLRLKFVAEDKQEDGRD